MDLEFKVLLYYVKYQKRLQNCFRFNIKIFDPLYLKRTTKNILEKISLTNVKFYNLFFCVRLNIKFLNITFLSNKYKLICKSMVSYIL